MLFLTIAILSTAAWIGEQNPSLRFAGMSLEEWAKGNGQFLLGVIMAAVSLASGIFPLYIFSIAGVLLVIMSFEIMAPLAWILMLGWFVAWITAAVMIYRRKVGALTQAPSSDQGE